MYILHNFTDFLCVIPIVSSKYTINYPCVFINVCTVTSLSLIV